MGPVKEKFPETTGPQQTKKGGGGATSDVGRTSCYHPCPGSLIRSRFPSAGGKGKREKKGERAVRNSTSRRTFMALTVIGILRGRNEIIGNTEYRRKKEKGRGKKKDGG